MTHAWCRDVARDEAVRAAEDGRDRPLPTLRECIVAPFAQDAKRSVEVSKTGDGQSGMRTERVTLEVTHGAPYCPAEWSWTTILRLKAPQSVRVVEEAHFDDLANMSLERDAAIRERDEHKARVDYLERDRKFWCLQSGTHEQAANVLRARVAELEAAAKLAPAANADAVSNPRPISGAGKSAGEETQATSGAAGTGWLDEVEREALEAARDYFDSDDHGDSECVFIARVLKQILARSSPPEVVLPPMVITYYDKDMLKEALAAAGVKVKEVGK